MRGIPRKEQALVRRRCGNLGALRELELWRLYERTSKPKPPQKPARLCLRHADHGIGVGPILLSDSKIFLVGFEDFYCGIRRWRCRTTPESTALPAHHRQTPAR